MDVFSNKAVYTAYVLLKGKLDAIDSNRTGIVISTRMGAVTSLRKCKNLINEQGYRAINPSLFPNVMLSTALLYVSKHCKAYGPSCVFYDGDSYGGDAMEYCMVQMQEGNVDAMIIIVVDEEGTSIGKYIKRSKNEDRFN
jgi:3-oxoacyl-(acyl-carrier-protein) synthase